VGGLKETQTVTYSVVIPAYNAERTLGSCLASVMAQTLAPLEVLVVDDHSADGTAGVVRDWQTRFSAAGIDCKYLAQPVNQGPSAARNRGVREACGEFVAFLDADDTWMEDKLATVDAFAKPSNAGLVCHAYTEIAPSQDDAHLPHRLRPLMLWQLLLKNPAQTSCSVMRRHPLRAFDETMRHCEDHDLWIRIAESSPVLQLLGPPLTRLGRPQLSAGGLSGSRWRMRFGEIRSYWKYCSRAWLRRGWLLPFLLAFSLSKHLLQEIRRWTT
jgi:teichuronic acid biosynthesis glycosyltransferase TuaG